MTQLAVCLGKVAPFYSLALVVIVVILFLKLFSMPQKKVYVKPWKLLFAAILVYILEELINILESFYILTPAPIVCPILEMAIIFLFIYMLLLQKEHLKNEK